MQFQVRWPLGDAPEIEFTVKRIPPAVMNNVVFEARGALKREGVEPPAAPFQNTDQELSDEWQAYVREFNAKKAYYLFDQAKNHFVAWKALKDGVELPPFSQAALVELVSYMTIDEKQALGFGYLLAELEDEKKSEPPKTSETAS